MKPFFPTTLFALATCVTLALSPNLTLQAEDQAGRFQALSENPRIVFCGDSITGQDGAWIGAGYCFQIDWAMKKVQPSSKTTQPALEDALKKREAQLKTTPTKTP